VGRKSKLYPATARSQFMLETVAELVGLPDFPYRQASVSVRRQGGTDWELTFLAGDSPDGLRAVADGQVTVAVVNPACLLTLARRGVAPLHGPQPLSPIAVIPSYDQFAVAVAPATGITNLAQVRERRYPLRVSVRGQRDHGVHWVIDHVLAAHGWTVGDLLSWGGRVTYDDGLPSRGKRIAMLAAGEVDAVIDEGVATWVDDALAAGATLVPMSPTALDRLCAWGYQRSELVQGVPTIDFSGFAVYVRDDCPADLVRQLCLAVATRADRIRVQDGTRLPLDGMLSGTPAAPLPAPLHEAAQRFWAELAGNQ
jgi:hypothetical protein